MIKHISFDVWNTLISANPEYSIARTQMIADITDAPFADVKMTYTEIKHKADARAEQCGEAFTTEQLVSQLLVELTGINDRDMNHLVRTKINELFWNHPPVMMTEVKIALQELHCRGMTLSIGSNSNFITGRVMHPWLQSELGHILSYGVFSDLDAVAKPSAAFFGLVIDQYRRMHTAINTKPQQILHIGDHPICDVWGANQLGMSSLLVANPQDLVGVIDRMIDEL